MQCPIINSVIYFILEKIKFKIIESEKELESGDILLVIDSSIEKKSNLYKRLKLRKNRDFPTIRS